MGYLTDSVGEERKFDYKVQFATEIAGEPRGEYFYQLLNMQFLDLYEFRTMVIQARVELFVRK